MSSWSAHEPPARQLRCSWPAVGCGRCCSIAATASSDPLSTHAFLRGGVLQLQPLGLARRRDRRGHAAGEAFDLPVRRRGRGHDRASVVRRRRALRPPPHDPRSSAWSARRDARPARRCGTGTRVTDVIVRGGRGRRRGDRRRPGGSSSVLAPHRDRSRRRRIDDRPLRGRRPRCGSASNLSAMTYGYWSDLETDGLRVDLPAERVLGHHPHERR